MITYYFDDKSQEYLILRDNVVIFATDDETLFYQVLDDILS